MPGNLIPEGSQRLRALVLPEMGFIDNMNKAYDPANEALGVSNWVTTVDLPDDSAFGATCDDPKNFRLAVTALDPTKTSITVKLEIKRDNSVVQALDYTLGQKERE